jgi:hypothetical protein
MFKTSKLIAVQDLPPFRNETVKCVILSKTMILQFAHEQAIKVSMDIVTKSLKYNIFEFYML